MKYFLSTFLFSLFIINSFSFAAIDPTSFTGQYRIGDCTQSGFTSVSVTQENLVNVKGLLINFYNSSSLVKSSFVAIQTNNTINLPSIQITVDSFTITNVLYTAYSSVLKTIKLGRSASGGRARLVETNQFGAKTFECVFYK